jgi:hypothetical protein
MITRSAGPLAGIFTKPPEVTADILSSRELVPGGVAGGLRVLAVYIAYTGKRLSASQRHTLERIKAILLSRAKEIEARKAA